MLAIAFAPMLALRRMDVVEPVDAGTPGAPPPPPGMEPPERPAASSDAIRAFLATVRRRLMLRAGLRTAGYGVALLGAALLLLALIAASMGPAAFWPGVTAGVLGGLFLVALLAGLWRPARAMRHDRAAARHAGVLLPALASDLLSAVELASPDTPDPRAAAVSARLILAFQDYVAGSVGAVDARSAGARCGRPRAPSPPGWRRSAR